MENVIKISVELSFIPRFICGKLPLFCRFSLIFSISVLIYASEIQFISEMHAKNMQFISETTEKSEGENWVVLHT